MVLLAHMGDEATAEAGSMMHAMGEMMAGGGFTAFGFLGFFSWLLFIILMVLAIVWLAQQISRK